jgi:hypothetical protein
MFTRHVGGLGWENARQKIDIAQPFGLGAEKW